MKRIKFQDNKEFYKKLKKATSDGEEVEVRQLDVLEGERMSNKWDKALTDEDQEIAEGRGDALGGNRYASAYKLADSIVFSGNVMAGSGALVALGMIGHRLTYKGGFIGLPEIVILAVLVGGTAAFIRMVLHGLAAILRATADTASTNAEILEAYRKDQSRSG